MNINNVNREELSKVLNEKLCDEIIRLRQIEQFTSFKDLKKKINGLGPKRIEQLEINGYICKKDDNDNKLELPNNDPAFNDKGKYCYCDSNICVGNECICIQRGKSCESFCHCSCNSNNKNVKDSDSDKLESFFDSFQKISLISNISNNDIKDNTKDLKKVNNDIIDNTNDLKKIDTTSLNVVCNCNSMCKKNQCACKKANKLCDPSRCGCCIKFSTICGNCSTDVNEYVSTRTQISVKSNNNSQISTKIIKDENNLIIASWNIQSFGHNYNSSKFRKLISRIVEFINYYEVDVLLIQETVDVRAVDDIIRFFNNNNKNNATGTNLSSAVIPIGQGFNRTLAAKNLCPRVEEYSTAIIRNRYINGNNLNMEVVDIKLKNEVPNEDENEHLKYRYKRLPAYITISINDNDRKDSRNISFVSLHLSSDSDKQRFRLNEELRTLPDVYEHVRQKEGIDTILLGDFNRTYVPSNVFSPYQELSEILLPVLSNVKSNTGNVKELYDNFWVPHNMLNQVVAATVGIDFLKLDPDDVSSNDVISDHYPIIFSLSK
jgi:endonuclease/exonuclease/phosphatase family metal-dependent hydrolase